MGKYFGTDGVRGKALIKLNETLAFRLGQGLSNAYDMSKVVIGYDTRASSPLLAHLIAFGAQSRGLKVYVAGVCSTPMIAYYSKEKAMIGIMVTASHNPYTDNGIKVFNKGLKSTPEEEALIEKVLDDPYTDVLPLKSLMEPQKFEQTYLALYEGFSSFQSKLNIAYDSANGGNYNIAKTVFSQFAPLAVQLENQPDGKNINANCGSTHMNRICDYVKANQLDIGFAFDGDGDRLLVCDQHRIYEGDDIVYMIARFLKKNQQLKDNHIVLTRMSNPGLLSSLKNEGIDYTLTDVGDKHIAKVLYKHQYAIGGEESGHIIINRILHTGDGLLAAIYLLYILDQENKPLHALIPNYERYPYQLENVKNVDRSLLEKPETKDFLKTIKKQLGDDALLIVRPSGTEPLLRITVSHHKQQMVLDTIAKIVDYFKKRSE